MEASGLFGYLQRWAAGRKRRPRIGIVAPVKEEGPYLLEWIAYHRALGVEKFILGDNGGADHTSDLLMALDAAGVIQRLDWRGETNFQIRFDLDAIPRMSGIVDVCSVTDVDEFLRPLGGYSDIPAAAGGIFNRPEVSAAALSWVTYGSSGRVEPGDGLVIERFTRRATDDHVFSRTVKTILRPERLTGMVNPHAVTLTSGEYVNDHNDPVCWGNVIGGTTSVSWHSLRVDHFVVKSHREFEGKAGRGRSDVETPRRDDAFFSSRDRNEVFDPMPAEFVARTKDEIVRLRDRLKRVVSDDSPLQELLRA
jgi:hypothetical protein